MLSTRSTSALAALIASLFVADAAFAQLDPGDKAPNLPLATLDGSSAKLYDLTRQNQAVVLSFWAKFLPISSAQLPALEKLNSRYSSKVQFVGLSLDIANKADMDAYLKRLRPAPTFPMAGSAVANKAKASFKVERFPTVFIINSKNVVSYVETGYSAKGTKGIEAALKRVLGGK